MEHHLFHVQLWKSIQDPVVKGQQRISAHMSRLPDISDLLLALGRIRTSLDAITSIWALEYLLPGTRTRWQTYTQREYISKLASRGEGNWKVVQELILQPQGIFFLESIILKNFSMCDIFGNLVPALRRKINNMRPKSKWSLEQRYQNKQVLYAERKRGYHDKGTELPGHLKRHQILDSLFTEEEYEKKKEVPFYVPRDFQWVEKQDVRVHLRVPLHTTERVKRFRGKEEDIMSLNSKRTNIRKTIEALEAKVIETEIEIGSQKAILKILEERILKHQDLLKRARERSKSKHLNATKDLVGLIEETKAFEKEAK